MSGGALRPVALVTGGQSGIGLACCRALAAKGFDLAVTGLEDEASSSLSAIAAEGSARLYYIRADLADVSGHAASVAAVEAALGPIACLVNNAGMGSVRRGDFLDMSPGDYDRIAAVNLKGTIFMTQAALRAMLAAPAPATRRSIICITSVSAAMSSPERIDYCVTKAGLAAFVSGLALRLAPEGIDVFEVRPGIIRTPMTTGVSARYDEAIASGLVPQMRWGEAEDVAAAVATLASGAIPYATGSTIHIDGGLSLARL